MLGFGLRLGLRFDGVEAREVGYEDAVAVARLVRGRVRVRVGVRVRVRVGEGPPFSG